MGCPATLAIKHSRRENTVMIRMISIPLHENETSSNGEFAFLVWRASSQAGSSVTSPHLNCTTSVELIGVRSAHRLVIMRNR